MLPYRRRVQMVFSRSVCVIDPRNDGRLHHWRTAPSCIRLARERDRKLEVAASDGVGGFESSVF